VCCQSRWADEFIGGRQNKENRKSGNTHQSIFLTSVFYGNSRLVAQKTDTSADGGRDPDFPDVIGKNRRNARFRSVSLVNYGSFGKHLFDSGGGRRTARYRSHGADGSAETVL